MKGNYQVSAPPIKAKYKQSSTGPTGKMLNTGKITRSSDASGQRYIQGLVPCTLQPKVQVVIRASAMWEKPLQARSEQASLRGRYLQPQKDHPPRSYSPGRLSRPGLHSSHNTGVKKSLGSPFKYSEPCFAFSSESAAND